VSMAKASPEAAISKPAVVEASIPSGPTFVSSPVAVFCVTSMSLDDRIVEYRAGGADEVIGIRRGDNARVYGKCVMKHSVDRGLARGDVNAKVLLVVRDDAQESANRAEVDGGGVVKSNLPV